MSIAPTASLEARVLYLAERLFPATDRLDAQQLGHLRHFEKLAAQLDGDWSFYEDLFVKRAACALRRYPRPGVAGTRWASGD